MLLENSIAKFVKVALAGVAFAALTLASTQPIFQKVLGADDLVLRDLVAEVARFPSSSGYDF